MMSTSGRKSVPRRYHHGDLRRALVRGGRELLQDGGVEALTLRAAADRAGVSVAAPYRHFADKQALLSAILADGLRELHESLAQLESVYPLDALRTLGHRFVDLIVAEPELFRLLATINTTPGADPELRRAEEAVFASFASAIAKAEASGAVEVESIEVVILTMRCVMQGLAGLIASGTVPTSQAHEAAEAVMSVVDRGLLPRSIPD
jgi:AcrR family transcriptional regulator